MFILCETAHTRRFSVIFAKVQWYPCISYYTSWGIIFPDGTGQNSPLPFYFAIRKGVPNTIQLVLVLGVLGHFPIPACSMSFSVQSAEHSWLATVTDRLGRHVCWTSDLFLSVSFSVGLKKKKNLSLSVFPSLAILLILIFWFPDFTQPLLNEIGKRRKKILKWFYVYIVYQGGM